MKYNRHIFYNHIGWLGLRQISYFYFYFTSSGPFESGLDLVWAKHVLVAALTCEDLTLEGFTLLSERSQSGVPGPSSAFGSKPVGGHHTVTQKPVGGCMEGSLLYMKTPRIWSHLELMLESQAHVYYLTRPPGQVGSFDPAQVASPNLPSQGRAPAAEWNSPWGQEWSWSVLCCY